MVFARSFGVRLLLCSRGWLAIQGGFVFTSSFQKPLPQLRGGEGKGRKRKGRKGKERKRGFDI